MTNNSFTDQTAFDGMRKNLLQDFTKIHHIDLHGNIRKNPKLSGTTHNVFGTQVGVGITIAIRHSGHTNHQLVYHRAPEDWRKEEKLSWLAKKQDIEDVEWQSLQPDDKHTWLVPAYADDFRALLPIGNRDTKAGKRTHDETIFGTFSIGINTSRDAWAYCFDTGQLTA